VGEVPLRTVVQPYDGRMSDVPDWAWKVGGVVVPALAGLLFRSEKIQGDRCGNCDRSNNYRVVGGITRGLAIIMGLGPVLLILGWVLIVEPPGLPVWAAFAMVGGGLVNEFLDSNRPPPAERSQVSRMR